MYVNQTAVSNDIIDYAAFSHTSKYKDTFTLSIDQIDYYVTAVKKSPITNLTVEEYTMAAAAFNRAGGTKWQWDDMMPSLGIKTSSTKFWANASLVKNPLADSLKQLTTPEEWDEVVALGFINKLSTTSTWHDEMTLQEDEFIGNSVMLPLLSAHRDILINAPCGSGKNWYWLNELPDDIKVIVLTSHLTVVSQQTTGGNPNDINDKTNRVFVFDKAEQIARLFTSGKLNPSKVILVTDEVHNLTTGTYRMKALLSLESILRFNWRNRVYQSATVSSHTFDGFLPADTHKVKFTKITSKTVEYTKMIGNPFKKVNIMNASADVIATLAGNMDIAAPTIVLYNDRTKLSVISEVLSERGITNIIVDRKTVRNPLSPAFKLANDPTFKLNGIMVVLGTSSVVEGISINDSLPRANAVIVGDEPRSHIIQLVGRFRNVEHIDCYHLTETVPMTSKSGIAKVVNELIGIRDEQLLTDSVAKLYRDSPVAADRALTSMLTTKNGSSNALVTVMQSGMKRCTISKTWVPTNYHLLFNKERQEHIRFYKLDGEAEKYITSMGVKWNEPVVYSSDEIDKLSLVGKMKELSQRRSSSIKQVVEMAELVAAGKITVEDSDCSKAAIANANDVIGVFLERTDDIAWAKKQSYAALKSKISPETLRQDVAVSLRPGGVQQKVKDKIVSMLAENGSDVITTEQAHTCVAYVFSEMVEWQRNSRGLSMAPVDVLLGKVLSNANWKRYKETDNGNKGCVKVVDGVIVSNLEHPTKLLTAFLKYTGLSFESKLVQRKGIRRREHRVTVVDVTTGKWFLGEN